MNFFEALKIIALGIIEGVTEWLPVSSTGHLIIAESFLTLEVGRDGFFEFFKYAVQLGAIIAVIVLFFDRMFPFNFKDKAQPLIKKDVLSTWLKVVVACVPGAIAVFLFDDFIEAKLSSPIVVAVTLVVYGVAFIVLERINAKREPKISTLSDVSFSTALYVGLFQILSIIPGTSRSGATILGALAIGVSRTAAAEFTFFLAVPVMLGMSLIKTVKFVATVGFFTSTELVALLLGMTIAFAVSLAVIKFLLGYIRKNDFTAFGVYRIALGILIVILVAVQAI